MKPEDLRAEIRRLEDRRLERQIVELASTERDARADELREAWRKRHPGGEA